MRRWRALHDGEGDAVLIEVRRQCEPSRLIVRRMRHRRTPCRQRHDAERQRAATPREAPVDASRRIRDRTRSHNAFPLNGMDDHAPSASGCRYALHVGYPTIGLLSPPPNHNRDRRSGMLPTSEPATARRRALPQHGDDSWAGCNRSVTRAVRVKSRGGAATGAVRRCARHVAFA